MTGYGKESARLYSKEPAVGYLARFVRPPQPRGVSMIANRPENGASTSGSADEVLAGRRSGPTALRIALGAQLRRLREARGVTTEEAAEAIRATHSKISRWNAAAPAPSSAMWPTCSPCTASPARPNANRC